MKNVIASESGDRHCDRCHGRLLQSWRKPFCYPCGERHRREVRDGKSPAPRIITRGTLAAANRKNRPGLTLRTRFQIMKRDGFRCQLCGVTALGNPRLELEIDHKVPLSRGGTNNAINLWTLCRDCNQGKSDQELPADDN